MLTGKRHLAWILVPALLPWVAYGNSLRPPIPHPENTRMGAWQTATVQMSFRQLNRFSCALSLPPQPLATPGPLLDLRDAPANVTVSFVIGSDGLVQSPLILESAGALEDERVLNAVKAWRYRPGTCNGAPSQAEARVEFSQR